MIKKHCLLLVVALLMAISVASATEPQVVVFNGKKYVAHTIVAGDTLYSLAKAYGVTEADILNAAKDITGETLTASQLKLGDKLFIPKKEEKASKRSKSAYRTHIVERGQTLYSIAKSYKISVAVIEEDNPSIDAQSLKPGVELRIRRSEMGYATTDEIERVERERSQTIEAGEGYHKVQPGETVYSLSRRYGITEEEFLKLNNLSSSADLKADMVVRVAAIAERSAEVESSTTTESSPENITEERSRRNRREREADDVVLSDSAMVADTLVDIYAGYGEFADTMELKPIDVEFLTLGRHNTLNVALMLPFHVGDKVNNNYVDFYKGVLLAMEDLKAEGLSIDLSVYDTEHSAQKIKELVDYEDGLLDANLIIGPVYEDELRYVLDLAEDNNIPVVSPLANIEGVKSPVLFQMQSEENRKYDKFCEVLDGSRELITIYASSNDMDFAQEIKAEAKLAPMRDLNFVFNREPFFYRRNADGSNGELVDIKELMRTQTAKAYVIVADRDTDIDRILTTLSSTRASIVDRGFNVGNYMVIGNRKWSRLPNIERQSFFRNNVAFLVPYHAKRSDMAIRIFDGRYIAAYNTLPSMYSYRGYDAAMIFCRKMYEGIGRGFSEERFMPLTTAYRFEFEDGIYVNTEWTLEQYTDHFRIEVK